MKRFYYELWADVIANSKNYNKQFGFKHNLIMHSFVLNGSFFFTFLNIIVFILLFDKMSNNNIKPVSFTVLCLVLILIFCIITLINYYLIFKKKYFIKYYKNRKIKSKNNVSLILSWIISTGLLLLTFILFDYYNL